MPLNRRTVLIGGFLAAVSTLVAESGTLRVRVTDATGGRIPMAKASLLDSAGKIIATEPANKDGEIMFTNLPAQRQKIRIECQGFTTAELVTAVESEKEVEVNVVLKVNVPVCKGLKRGELCL